MALQPIANLMFMRDLMYQHLRYHSAIPYDPLARTRFLVVSFAQLGAGVVAEKFLDVPHRPDEPHRYSSFEGGPLVLSDNALQSVIPTHIAPPSNV